MSRVLGEHRGEIGCCIVVFLYCCCCCILLTSLLEGLCTIVRVITTRVLVLYCCYVLSHYGWERYLKTCFRCCAALNMLLCYVAHPLQLGASNGKTFLLLRVSCYTRGREIGKTDSPGIFGSYTEHQLFEVGERSKFILFSTLSISNLPS